MNSLERTETEILDQIDRVLARMRALIEERISGIRTKDISEEEWNLTARLKELYQEHKAFYCNW